MKKIFAFFAVALISFGCFADEFIHSFGLNLRHQYTYMNNGPKLDDWVLDAELSGEFDYTFGESNIFTLGVDTGFSGGICPTLSFYESSDYMLSLNLAPLAGATFAKKNKELCVFQLQALPFQLQTNFVFANTGVVPVLHMKTGGRFNLFMGNGRIKHGIEAGANMCIAGASNGKAWLDTNGYEIYFGYRMCLLNK